MRYTVYGIRYTAYGIRHTVGNTVGHTVAGRRILYASTVCRTPYCGNSGDAFPA